MVKILTKQEYLDQFVIHNEKEYDDALALLERKWDTKPNSPEEDEFIALANAIEVYEDEHYPIEPPSLEEAIKFRMDQEKRVE